MKVMLVDSGLDCRGGQRQVWRLAGGLARLGYQVHLLAPAESWLAQSKPVGVSWSAWTARSDWDLRAGLELARIARQCGITLVHVHDARSHAAGRWAQLMGWDGKLIVSRRSSRVPRGRLKYLRGVARYIAISAAVRRSLLQAGVPGERIDLVPSAVPSGLPPLRGAARERIRNRWGVRSGEAMLLTLSALTKEKGLDVLVDAALLLRTQGLRARWMVWGDGPLRSVLEARAWAARAPVVFAGFTEEPDILLRSADLLVHPAVREGLGTAVLEAMAHALPVVASAVDELRDLVPRAGGLTVPARDPRALAAAVAGFLHDPARLRLASQLGPRVARRFSLSRMIRGTVRTYKKALAAGKRVS